MLHFKDFNEGDEVVILKVGNAARGIPSLEARIKPTKILHKGKKYIVTAYNNKLKFYEPDFNTNTNYYGGLVSKADGCIDYVLFHNVVEIQRGMRAELLYKSIYTFMRDSGKTLDLEQLEAIARIIGL